MKTKHNTNITTATTEGSNPEVRINGKEKKVKFLTNTTDPLIEVKKYSVLDFAYLSLEELEDQVVSLFPDEEDAEGYFHYNLLNAVIFRKVCEGWNKKELLDLVDREFDYATKHIAKLDKEVA